MLIAPHHKWLKTPNSFGLALTSTKYLKSIMLRKNVFKTLINTRLEEAKNFSFSNPWLN
jgi:hypothetical protein